MKPARFFTLLGSLPCLMALAALAPAADPKPPVDLDKAKAQYVAAAYLEGQLTAVDVDEKKFTLKVSFKSQVVNEKVKQQLAGLAQQYQQARAAKKPDFNRINNLTSQISAAEAKLYDPVDESIDFELKGTEKLACRTLIEPTKEDGKKYNSFDLARLRGNTTLPGYPLELKELAVDKWVHVYLDKTKLTAGKAKDDVYTAVTIVVIQPKDKTTAKTTTSK